MVLPLPRSDHPGAVAVGSFAVLPKQQGHGLGSTLLAAAEAWAAERGHRKMLVEVPNHRVDLYDGPGPCGEMRCGKRHFFHIERRCMGTHSSHGHSYTGTDPHHSCARLLRGLVWARCPVSVAGLRKPWKEPPKRYIFN